MSKKTTKGWSLFFVFPKIGKIFNLIGTLVKGAKILGPLFTILSMTASIWAYSYSMGWKLALLFVILLFVHEMGHVIACWKKGIKASAPLFIPFIGALIFAPGNMDREKESYMGFGGPLLGTLGCLFVWLIWWLIPSHPPILLAGSFIGLWLNLFNMMPISPFDGGRILQSVGNWIRWVGLTILLAITVLMKDPTLLYIWIIVMCEFRFKNRYIIMTFILFMMVMGFAFNVGGQKALASEILICILSGILCVYAWLQDKKMVDEEAAIRPPQPKRRGLFWLGAYLTLFFVLLTSMWLQSQQFDAIQKAEQKEQGVKT